MQKKISGAQRDSCGRYNGHIGLCGIPEDGMRDWVA